jgi:hypothetical protein
MRHGDTVTNIINDASIELGLITTELADPFDSTDANIVQLLRHLKAEGQDLCRDHNWSFLVSAGTVTTANGTASYALSDLVLRILPDSVWNNTRDRRLLPLSAEQYLYYSVNGSSGLTDQHFRLREQLDDYQYMYIVPTPTAIETITFHHIHDSWVNDQGNGGTSYNLNTPVDGLNGIAFDRRLMVCGAKLRFLRAKGFPTDAVREDYDRALARALGADDYPRTLNISGPGGGRLIDTSNLPDSGYGG